MRILIVTSFPIPGEYDGTAMLPIKILRALKRSGIQVSVAYLKARRPWGPVVREEFEGVPLFTLSLPSWMGGMKKIQRDVGFDIVHAQHYGGATRVHPACRLYDWPLVYEIHSLLGEEVERDRLGRGLVFRGYQAMERKVFQHVAAVIALGEPVKDFLIKEKRVPLERVHVIYPGIDLGEFQRPLPPADIPGVGPEHRVVMYVGSIVHPNQGVPILIEALPKVFRSVSEARCVLVGGPAEAGEEYQKRLGADGNKLFVLPGKTPDEVVALARRADVLVHPRLACRENFSVQSKLAVYLAAGRPIVATNFGDYVKLLGDTGAGLLTEESADSLSDGIVRVLKEPELAAGLARATGPVASEFFGMERNLQRYLDVYQKALEAGPR